MASQPEHTDPRIARSRTAVLRAARELLTELGPAGVTVDAVVARSGVAKSTIYRHWASRDEVLLAVMESAAPLIAPPPPDLEFEPALRSVVAQVGAVFADPDWARMLPALLMLKMHEPGLAELQRQLQDAQQQVLIDVLDRGVGSGQVGAGYDVHEVAAQLIGPLLFAVATGEVVIDEDYCNRLVDRFLAGSPRALGGSRPRHAR